jgi:hypothetical protein
MDVRRDAGWASANEGESDMPDTTTMRRCLGSARFGIEPHEAPVEEFPAQPSQKDGLGRMCKAHWNQYTAGLARDAKARKAPEAGEAAAATEAVVTAQADREKRTRRRSPRTPAVADGPGAEVQPAAE